MIRQVSIVAVVLLATGAAYGHVTQTGEVVSYCKINVNVSGSHVVVSAGEIPAGGFVLTDVIVTDESAGSLCRFTQGSTYLFTVLSSASVQSWHLNSGVQVEPGTNLTVDFDGSAPHRDVTISGYVPAPGAGTVPAISGVGFALMVVALAALGGAVFRRKKQA